MLLFWGYQRYNNLSNRMLTNATRLNNSFGRSVARTTNNKCLQKCSLLTRKRDGNFYIKTYQDWTELIFSIDQWITEPIFPLYLLFCSFTKLWTFCWSPDVSCDFSWAVARFACEFTRQRRFADILSRWFGYILNLQLSKHRPQATDTERNNC